MKRKIYENLLGADPPAAFGRLCVETINIILTFVTVTQPPSGGCVLKP